MSQTFKSATHGDQLVKLMSDLLPTGTTKYSDVKISVGGEIFHCHKLILILQSAFFEEKFSNVSNTDTLIECADLSSISVEDFAGILRFMYTCEIELSGTNVLRILPTAFHLKIPKIVEFCSSYMQKTVNAIKCCPFWKAADLYGATELATVCKQFILKEFPKALVKLFLIDLPVKLLKELMAADDLTTSSEVDVCEVLLKWMEGNCELLCNCPHELYSLLTLIRWSVIPLEYVKLKFLRNKAFMEDGKCFKFLVHVISYHLTGVQFEDLRTFPRPSIGYEHSLVIVGMDVGESISSDVYCLNMRCEECPAKRLPSLPTSMQFEAAACVYHGTSLYLTGVGSSSKEVWKWDIVFGWGRCANMNRARRRHCTTFDSENSLFVLGGFHSGQVIGDVEVYSVVSNSWTQVGNLARPVESAGCILNRTSIYLFGGVGSKASSDECIDLDCIQVFDTATKQCVVLEQRLPRPERLLRAVMWEQSVIIISYRTCLIFDIEQKTFRDRKQFSAAYDHFGLVLENQKIFIFGGELPVAGNGRCFKQYMYSDTVKSTSVMDIINNRSVAQWDLHTKLPDACCVHAFGIVKLPVSVTKH